MMQGRRSDTNVIVNGRAGKEAGTAKRRYLLYMLCAAVSTVMNLGSQALVKIVFRHADPPSGEAAGRGIAAVAASVTLFGLPLSFIIQLAVGTGFGLISKFLLDKFLVFKDSYQGLGKTVRQLLFYSLLAVITTLVFWGFEVGFRLAFSFPYADIAGGLIGLIIGYTIKYYLDRRFIFR